MKYILGDFFSLHFHPQTFDGIITDVPYKGCIKRQFGEENFSVAIFLAKTAKETKDDAFLITFANFLTAMDLIASSKETAWQFHTHQVWDKRPVRTWISWGHPLRHTEYVLYFKKGAFKYRFTTGERGPPYKRRSFGGPMKETRENDRTCSHAMYPEIMCFNVEKEKVHPAQKPREWSYHFKQVVGGDVYVLDPFAGSGNLLVAFKRSVGIDLVNYCSRDPVPVKDILESKKRCDLLGFMTGGCR